MEYVIKNEALTVSISDIGAEPQSIKHLGEEYLWEANPNIWGKHAPLLFPIIGRLRDGAYEYNGKTIKAPRHGFCRERHFEVSKLNEASIVFSTREDEATLSCFPFSFILEVEYQLNENTLTKIHRITNTGSYDLPFELGGHEAYSLKGFENDWSISFEETNKLSAFGMDTEGILTLPKWNIELSQSQLNKTPEELSIDTIILEEVPNSRVKLTNLSGSKSVMLNFEDFDYLGIWTMAGQTTPGYICIEPWTTLPDGHFMSKNLFQKPGIQIVKPGDTKTLTYQITFN